ncbi:MAG: hypothetical protein JW760_00200 [Spirochaetales bacterium]|nr:hypothetical protein [Spirochaetales bacterium]
MKKTVCILFLFSLCLFTLSADGGGGMFFGRQQSGYPFFEDLVVTNNSLGLTYYGGYGYGISSGNTITGGFGLAVTDPLNEAGISGGFGGLMNGVRLIKRPVTLQIINCAGLGGVSLGMNQSEGFFGFFDELTLELGIPLVSWFMPVFYVGYQVFGRIGTRENLFELYSYTPVMGIRIGWGDFL